MNLFDILGPVMVGPSSSHTAGAVRIGYVASRLLEDEPVKVDIVLHGSFATTGVGHGTDKALIAGLLGMAPDDIRIPQSFELAKKNGLAFSFTNKTLKDAHPNTAVLKLTGKHGKQLEIQAASIGGGRIMIHKLDGVAVVFSAEKPTLIVYNQDQPGYVAQVTTSLSKRNVNIATMNLYRDKRGGFAVMVLETDQQIPLEAIHMLEQLEGIMKVSYIDTEE
ncbi:MAG: L-serine ammonia-lyase, iron-sulfur-dependent subunit beta [Lachnospiraceae bacterium]|nr:L-serine ammonia-lyase, iron-sulfur-dependent subunit beta [Lachnospiraceae bacterium]